MATEVEKPLLLAAANLRLFADGGRDADQAALACRKLDRLFRVLDAHLATRLGLARSTIRRIVGALIDEGLLINAGPRAGVALGPALTRLAAAAIIDTERMVHPVLQELSAATGEAVDLSVLQGDSAVFVDQVMGNSRLVAVSAVGEAFPLHCTANGKALLGRLSRERRDRLLVGELRRFTPHTITDRAALERDLADIAATGLAWDMEEHSQGICVRSGRRFWTRSAASSRCRCRHPPRDLPPIATRSALPSVPGTM